MHVFKSLISVTYFIEVQNAGGPLHLEDSRLDISLFSFCAKKEKKNKIKIKKVSI